MSKCKTRQEIFDLAYIGLASQGFQRSLDDVGSCAYRGEDGKKCAIGFCIPDEKYDDLIEGQPASELEVITAAGAHVRSADFLERLQNVHDSRRTPTEMKSGLIAFAESYKLTVPEAAI